MIFESLFDQRGFQNGAPNMTQQMQGSTIELEEPDVSRNLESIRSPVPLHVKWSSMIKEFSNSLKKLPRGQHT